MITYGGIVLGQPTPAVAAFVDAHPLDLQKPQNFDRTVWTEAQEDRYGNVRLNHLYWPVGASRWAFASCLATQGMLRDIRRQAYPSTSPNRYTALPFTMTDGMGGTLTTSLFMLPARPLNTMAGGEFYLLELVDERYFWWEVAASLFLDPGFTTWAELIGEIATALDITIATDTISTAYLTPAAALVQPYAPLPILLDLAAQTIGHRVVRTLTGAVKTQTAATARALQNAQLATAIKRCKAAGGNFAFDANRTNDLAGRVPASVTVTFPKTVDDVASDEPYTIAKTLVSLTLPTYGQTKGHPGTKTLANLTAAPFEGMDVTPTNETDLQALATQAAKDFYGWQLAKVNARYDGIHPWPVDAFSDLEWSSLPGGASTRVQRPEEMTLSLATAAVVVDGGEAEDPCILHLVRLDLEEDKNDWNPSDACWWIITPVTDPDPPGVEGSWSITGIGNPTPGRTLYLTNDSNERSPDGCFYLRHENHGSTDVNRIHSPTLTDIMVSPGQTVKLVYGIHDTDPEDDDEDGLRWGVVSSNYPLTYLPNTEVTQDPIPSGAAQSLAAHIEEISSDSDTVSITGLTPDTFWDGRVVTFYNTGTKKITWTADGDAIVSQDGRNVLLPPKGHITLLGEWAPGEGDGGQRWRVIDQTGITGIKSSSSTVTCQGPIVTMVAGTNMSIAAADDSITFTASAGSLTVQDVDATPSYNSITTLQFDQADGFIITNPSAGVARIDLPSFITHVNAADGPTVTISAGAGISIGGSGDTVTVTNTGVIAIKDGSSTPTTSGPTVTFAGAGSATVSLSGSTVTINTPAALSGRATVIKVYKNTAESPWTPDDEATLVRIRVTVQAPGGGGAGVSGTSGQAAAGGGGGAGCWCSMTIEAAALASSESLTIDNSLGDGGVGGADGDDGGQATFGGFITCDGGSGGKTMASGTSVAVASGGEEAGGTISGGDNHINAPMESGDAGIRLSGSVCVSGAGGSTPFGGGGHSNALNGAGNVTGIPGNGYGSGGSGGATTNSTSMNGGGGAPGLIIVEEFYD